MKENITLVCVVLTAAAVVCSWLSMAKDYIWLYLVAVLFAVCELGLAWYALTFL